MKKINKILSVVLILLLGSSITYPGGGTRTGTGGAAQLLIPVGAQGIAMGESNVATAYGIDALFWNPAGVAKMNNSASVTFSHMSYIADIGVEYGAVSANFEGFGIVSLNVKSLSLGEILVTTTRDPDGTGETFSPQMLVAGVSYSRQLTERIAVGLTANYLTETLGDASASGIAFNIGVLYDNLASINGLSFGVVIKNLGPQMQYDGSGLLQQATVTDFNRPPQLYKVESAPFELPTTFELGLGYRPNLLDDMNSLLITTAFKNNNFSDDEYKVGLEYGYNKMFFLRGGYTFAPQATEDSYIYGFTGGVGVNYSFETVSVRVDYAYRYAKYFDGNHIIGVSLGF
jgi:long-subunit fatty acid transport protein